MRRCSIRRSRARAPWRAQGGGDFEDLEIARAVVYLANAGGAKFAEPKAPTPQLPASAADSRQVNKACLAQKGRQFRPFCWAGRRAQRSFVRGCLPGW
jgi:hypothetical protein